MLAFGGFRVQAKTREAAQQLLLDAKVLQDEGVFAVVIEGVPSVVGSRVTEALDIPTIGIGAGPDTDGQVLVFHDLLGLTKGKPAKFVRQYANLGSGHHRGVAPLRQRRAKWGVSRARRGVREPRRVVELAVFAVETVDFLSHKRGEVPNNPALFSAEPG